MDVIIVVISKYNKAYALVEYFKIAPPCIRRYRAKIYKPIKDIVEYPPPKPPCPNNQPYTNSNEKKHNKVSLMICGASYSTNLFKTGETM